MSGSVSIGQGGDRLVDLEVPGKSGSLQAARPVADGSLGPQRVGRGVGPDELAVGDPDLVRPADLGARLAGHDLGRPGVAEHDVDLGGVFAASGPGPLDDPQPQRREAGLGVTHEVEQLVDAGQAGRERGDGREPPAIDGGRDGSGAVPQARVGHRRGL